MVWNPAYPNQWYQVCSYSVNQINGVGLWLGLVVGFLSVHERSKASHQTSSYCTYSEVLSLTVSPHDPGHGVELPFVFHTAALGGFNFTKDEQLLSDNMVRYWTTFAHHGDPNGPAAVGPGRRGRGSYLQRSKGNGGSLLSWPQYDGSDQAKCMRFKTPESGVSTINCILPTGIMHSEVV